MEDAGSGRDGSVSDVARDTVVAARRLEDQQAGLTRQASWHGSETSEPKASTIAVPGGFRRTFVLGQAASSDAASPEPSDVDQPDVAAGSQDASGAARLRASGAASSQARGLTYAETTSFLGEYRRVEGYATSPFSPAPAPERPLGLHPRLISPLLRLKPVGDGSQKVGVTEVKNLVLMIAKGFTGSAVLYLPHAFADGGLALAGVSLVAIAVVSISCMRQLIDCADLYMKRKTTSHVPSYGAIGAHIMGPMGRILVDTCVVSSQCGFCATYVVFICANVREVIEVFFKCDILLQQNDLLPLLFIFLVPLAWIRGLKAFETMNAIADVCIATGLILILGTAGWNYQIAPPFEPVEWIGWDKFSLTLGTLVYTFEGIAMILPMYDNTDPSLRPHFKSILTNTLTGILVFFMIFAVCCSLAFGARTQTMVLLSLPIGSKLKTFVQLIYCAALALTYPLALYPVTDLLETRVFGCMDTGRRTCGDSIRRNFLRTCLVALTIVVALSGPARLAQLVALIGALSCAPLAITFPSAMHDYLVGDRTGFNKLFVVIGISLMVFSTVSAIASWSTAEIDAPIPRACAASARRAAQFAILPHARGVFWRP